MRARRVRGGGDAQKIGHTATWSSHAKRCIIACAMKSRTYSVQKMIIIMGENSRFSAEANLLDPRSTTKISFASVHEDDHHTPCPSALAGNRTRVCCVLRSIHYEQTFGVLVLALHACDRGADATVIVGGREREHWPLSAFTLYRAASCALLRVLRARGIAVE